MNANRLKMDSAKTEREELQTKAISCCDQLSCYIELAMNLGLIGSDTVMQWQKQVNDVKYMTIAWRSKGKTR